MPEFAQTKENWSKLVKPYAVANHNKSWIQFFSSIAGFMFFWFLAYKALAVSYLLTLALSSLSFLFSVRIFIILHDCGHGSYFKSKKLRTIVGYICGIFTITPYQQWTKSHGIHHSTSGNLDKRGIGDMLTYTTGEYEKLTLFQKVYYRFYRHPIMTFFLGPLYIFVVDYRFTSKIDGPKERKSVHITNAALALILIGAHFTIGLKAFFLIQFPITLIACSIGSWLFYVQHQYEDPYWEREENWDFFDAAIIGSSFYKLPKVFQWFTGNIGFHHVHHLSPRIPNYLLEKCYKENTIFQKITPITLWTGLKSLSFRLWDEENRKLVGYRYLRALGDKQFLAPESMSPLS